MYQRKTKPRKAATVIVCVRMDADTRDHLAMLAARQDISNSEAVRQAVEMWIAVASAVAARATIDGSTGETR